MFQKNVKTPWKCNLAIKYDYKYYISNIQFYLIFFDILVTFEIFKDNKRR